MENNRHGRKINNVIYNIKTKRNLRKNKKKKYKEAKSEYEQSRNFLFRIIKKIIDLLFCFIGCFLCAIIIGCICTYIIAYPTIKAAREKSFDVLKNINDSYFTSELEPTLIYDKDNNIIGKINNKNFEYVDIEDISDYIINGYIAVEDRNFKSHIGIDIKGIARAGVQFIANKGKITQGGSTITQQLIKNTILTNEKTFSRKITEIVIALDLEAQPDISKQEIMEWYVNTNFYGQNCYGLQSACQYYFNTTAKDVTLAQAAMLVGISNAPGRYDPVNNYKNCIEKAERVLSQIYSEGYVTEDEYQNALNQLKSGIKIEKTRKDTVYDNSSYPVTYTLHCATLELMKKDNFKFKYIFDSKESQNEYNELYSKKYNEKYNEIRNGGYRIYTSLDIDIQSELQAVIDDKLSIYQDKSEDNIYTMQSAAVCIDNRTNYVIAIVGGRSKSGEFNRAYQSARQPGSSIKPILDYAPAIESGRYNPGSYVMDEPIKGDYQPNNWYAGYKGPVTLRYALGQSINTVACKLLQDITPSIGLSYLGKMEFSHIDYSDINSLSTSLGGFTYGVSPLEMAKAYNTIINKGQYSERNCIRYIESDNSIIFSSCIEKTKYVYSEDTAFLIADMLKSNVYSGICGAASVNGQIVGGKTGTTNDNKDAWFCGFSNYYTTAVWVGCDIPKKTNVQSGWVAEIWKTYMGRISESLPKSDFEQPDTVVVVNGEYVSSLNCDPYTFDPYATIAGVTSFDTLNVEIIVSDFERYVINSDASADNYSEEFQKVMNAINTVDGEEYQDFADRVMIKKGELDLAWYNWQQNTNED